jgi:hypothetical protein
MKRGKLNIKEIEYIRKCSLKDMNIKKICKKLDRSEQCINKYMEIFEKLKLPVEKAVVEAVAPEPATPPQIAPEPPKKNKFSDFIISKTAGQEKGGVAIMTQIASEHVDSSREFNKRGAKGIHKGKNIIFNIKENKME